MKQLVCIAVVAAVIWGNVVCGADQITSGKAMHVKLLAGAAARSIVPDPDLVNNALHSNMTVRFDERGSELQVKALALKFGNSKRLLLALDIVYIPNPHAEKMRRTISLATGLPEDEIVITASHSHSTPFVEAFEGRQPYFEFVLKRSVEAAEEALRKLLPAKLGTGVTHVVGASFNTRVPLENGGVKFSRDFREGLASGRPIDPRLSVLRFDDEQGRPIAGWVRFAAHPACVIFNTPISAEYPGYMTDGLSAGIAGKPPILFGYGASGDVNCVPMFGMEADSRNLGKQLAEQARVVFNSIKTHDPKRFLATTRTVELPLEPIPSIETLDREIAEVEKFIAELDKNPELEWVLGINCKKGWPVANKKRHAQPLADWARKVKTLVAQGHNFPTTWSRRITVWVIDDLALVFESGETLVDVSLNLSARSPLAETLLVSMSGGADAYLGSDSDRRRAGYETFTSTRYAMLKPGSRPLPYALGTADRYVAEILNMINSLK